MNWKERIMFFIVVYLPSSILFNLMLFTVLWLFNYDYSLKTFLFAQALALLPFLLRYMD